MMQIWCYHLDHYKSYSDNTACEEHGLYKNQAQKGSCTQLQYKIIGHFYTLCIHIASFAW